MLRTEPLTITDVKKGETSWLAYVVELGDYVSVPWSPSASREEVVQDLKARGNKVTA